MGGKYSGSKGEAKCIKIGLETFCRGKKKKPLCVNSSFHGNKKNTHSFKSEKLEVEWPLEEKNA